MKSDDWRDMDTAPLNPYGKPWGPVVLIWNAAAGTPMAAYFEPWHSYKDRDCGPGWVLSDADDAVIAPEDAIAWMPIAAPWCVLEQPRPASEDDHGQSRIFTTDSLADRWGGEA